MKKMHILQIALIAILFSACSSLISGKSAAQNNGNQATVQSNNKTTETSVENSANENENSKKLDNVFAGLDSGEQKEETQPEAPVMQQQKSNPVCPIPDKPCKHKEKEFAEWELPFKFPARIAPNKTYLSAPFYAVILKTYKNEDDCDGGEFIISLENERKEFQDLQPDRKVFAHYGCPNMDAVNYDFQGRMDAAGENVLIDNFIAVYAGETAEEAEVVRRSVRDEYPKAVVKKMTANWERIEQ
jgi:hypothetical protein